MKIRSLTCVLPLFLAWGCAHRTAAPPPLASVEAGWTQKGEASWYGRPYHGRRTASGEVYNMYELTAAHRTLPFGTEVKVSRRDTGATVVVRINDRGPFVKGRIIDLSFAAAKRIRLDVDGVAPVKVKVVGFGHAQAREKSPPPREPGCWWVQVGAFADPGNARASRNRLRAAGETAVMIEGPNGLQRVRVGPFETEDEAEKASRRLAGDWPSASVVACGG